RAAAWPEHDIEAVLAALIRAVTDDELRTLVSGIHARRSTFGLRADERALAVTQACAETQAQASRRAG
ncbi:MAG: AlpA family transcriptional regulator, partial [Thiocapsa sp. N5-Cardenillas]